MLLHLPFVNPTVEAEPVTEDYYPFDLCRLLPPSREPLSLRHLQSTIFNPPPSQSPDTPNICTWPLEVETEDLQRLRITRNRITGAIRVQTTRRRRIKIRRARQDSSGGINIQRCDGGDKANDVTTMQHEEDHDMQEDETTTRKTTTTKMTTKSKTNRNKKRQPISMKKERRCKGTRTRTTT